MTESDPYAGEPAEDELPPKPELDPDADALAEHEDPGEEPVADEEFMEAEQAAEDATVDDAEGDEIG
jgi:hypothetical protein